jgi:Domain of unknown function (DUF4345)
MRPITEKRLLQAVVLLACLVPLSAGPVGIWRGASWIAHGAAVTPELDSHFRYMSGIFTGVGLAFLSCVIGIEAKGKRLRMLAGFVVLGGLARGFSWIDVGMPDIGHRLGLVMELGVTPLIALWQWRFARRWANTPYRG